MKYITATFSPTGGTAKVVNALTKDWGSPKLVIDLTESKGDFKQITLEPEDVAVIAVPSYGGRVPSLAADRLSKIRGNGAKAVLVCVYGNRAYEDTLVELMDLVKQAGFVVTAAVAALAEHSILRQFASGRPDARDEEILAGFSKKIQDKLKSGTKIDEAVVPGDRPYKKAGGIGMIPKTESMCTQCGLCAKKCPAGAIDQDNVKLIDKTKCISCMRCVTNCPQNAKTVNGMMLKAASVALSKACSIRKECELYL